MAHRFALWVLNEEVPKSTPRINLGKNISKLVLGCVFRVQHRILRSFGTCSTGNFLDWGDLCGWAHYYYYIQPFMYEINSIYFFICTDFTYCRHIMDVLRRNVKCQWLYWPQFSSSVKAPSSGSVKCAKPHGYVPNSSSGHTMGCRRDIPTGHWNIKTKFYEKKPTSKCTNIVDEIQPIEFIP